MRASRSDKVLSMRIWMNHEYSAKGFMNALSPGLHIVATPIGHLGDLSPRMAQALREADHVLCEDTRVTGKLLSHLGHSRRLISYHEHNAEARRAQVTQWLQDGASIVLTSDAGTPLVSDPGYKLVRLAIELGITVSHVPGPTAVVTALVVSGLASDRFMFAGFLPSKEGARNTAIDELASIPATLILFESGSRLAACLAALAKGLGERQMAVCRELTKRFEEVRRGSIADLAQTYADLPAPKGEIVLVIERAAEAAVGDVSDAELDQLIAAHGQGDKPRQIAERLSKLTRISKNELYQRIIARRHEG